MIRVIVSINENVVRDLYAVNDGTGTREIGNYTVYDMNNPKTPLFRMEGHNRGLGAERLAGSILLDYWLNIFQHEMRDCLTCKCEPKWVGMQGEKTNNASGICMRETIKTPEDYFFKQMPYPGREYCEKWESK